MGLAYGLGKTVVILRNTKASVPVDLKRLEYVEYESIDQLRRNLDVFFKTFGGNMTQIIDGKSYFLIMLRSILRLSC